MAAHVRGLNARAFRTPLPKSGYTVYVRSLVRCIGGRTILNDIGLEIASGEFVALLGQSGSGKSTLIRTLAGLDHGMTGNGEIHTAARQAVIFQDARLLPWKRALANVMFGLRGRDALRRAKAALAEVGLSGRDGAWPGELSGGEQQRVALARALVREPALLLADEPFGALDALTRLKMHALLRTLCQRHQPAVLLVTHDISEALTLAGRILVLRDGRVSASFARAPVSKTGSAPGWPAGVHTQLLRELGVETDASSGNARMGPPDSCFPYHQPKKEGQAP